MAEFKEVIKQRKRMCDYYDCCREEEICPLVDHKIGCTWKTLEEPNVAEKIIMEWAKEHPVKTNADKFKEVFGIGVHSTLQFCIDGCPCFTCPKPRENCEECSMHGFWEKEYKEQPNG